MKRPTKSTHRMWRASLIRAKAERLEIVWAPGREVAEAAPVEEFGLKDEQRKRLMIQEQL